jgi:hypothetical protein
VSEIVAVPAFEVLTVRLPERVPDAVGLNCTRNPQVSFGLNVPGNEQVLVCGNSVEFTRVTLAS